MLAGCRRNIIQPISWTFVLPDARRTRGLHPADAKNKMTADEQNFDEGAAAGFCGAAAAGLSALAAGLRCSLRALVAWHWNGRWGAQERTRGPEAGFHRAKT
jgi:hypothetical protein